MKRISSLLIVLPFCAVLGFARGNPSGGADVEGSKMEPGPAIWNGGGVKGLLDNTLRGGM
jgi:hypothetical protein